MCDSLLISQPNVSSGIISVANSHLDGTGTLVTVFTAGTIGVQGGGSVVNSILIKAQQQVTQGMVRLYINQAQATRLFREVPIPAQPLQGGVGNTQSSFSIQFNVGFTLPPGASILASTQNAEIFNVFVFGTNFGYCNCPA